MNGWFMLIGVLIALVAGGWLLRYALIGGGGPRISVYARVVDQDGAPVQGARAPYRLTSRVLISLTGGDVTDYGTLVTDADGRFEYSRRGTLLYVDKVEKPGYVFENDGRFRISVLAPDKSKEIHSSPEAPHVIRAWRLTNPVRLSSPEFQLTTDSRGGTYWVDLTSGERGRLVQGEAREHGLLVSIRQEDNGPSGHPADWTVTLHVPNGGLTRAEDPFLFAPPAAGYQETWSQRFEGSIGEARDIKANFYFVQAGVYGSLRVTINPYFQASNPLVSIVSTVNPSGSRNLEQAY